jgi:cytochrome c oxidase subunit 3
VSVIILFLALIAGIAFWWLSRQRLTAKPWMEEGVIGDLPDADMHEAMLGKIGLGVFLAVVGCLFALLISAYFIRMDATDWRPLPIPNLLWFNTSILIISSAALQWAKVAAVRNEIENVKMAVLAGGFCALLFLVGQLLAWRLLAAAGYYVAAGPANSFFYLLTGLHGLHLAGGLVVLGWSGEKLLRGAPLVELRSSLALCATYWHFLLALWLVLFAVLTGYAGDFVKICSTVLS